MKFRKTNTGFIAILYENDKIIESLTRFCKENEVFGGAIYAIGAFKNCVLGYLDEEKESYIRKEFGGGLEAISVKGNISKLENGEPMVHLHASVGDRNFNVFGGHLFEGVVNPTMEIFIYTEDSINRNIKSGPFTLINI